MDIYPFGGAFRLSGGVVWNKSRADGRASLAEPLEIGNRVYQPSEIGQVLARGSYGRKIAPYAGLGFGTRGRVGLIFDLGLAFSGRPDVTLTGQTNLTGPEKDEFDQNIALEEAQIRQSIQDEPWLRFYPIVALGVKLRF